MSGKGFSRNRRHTAEKELGQARRTLSEVKRQLRESKGISVQDIRRLKKNYTATEKQIEELTQLLGEEDV